MSRLKDLIIQKLSEIEVYVPFEILTKKPVIKTVTKFITQDGSLIKAADHGVYGAGGGTPTKFTDQTLYYGCGTNVTSCTCSIGAYTILNSWYVDFTDIQSIVINYASPAPDSRYEQKDIYLQIHDNYNQDTRPLFQYNLGCLRETTITIPKWRFGHITGKKYLRLRFIGNYYDIRFVNFYYTEKCQVWE